MKDLSQRLTPNFRRREFEDETTDVSIDMRVVNACQQIRDVWGIPMTITSGVRSERKNTEVGGSPNSSHLKGLAADFLCKSSRLRYQALKVLMDNPDVTRIGIGEDFIHIDVDESKVQDVVWDYYK